MSTTLRTSIALMRLCLLSSIFLTANSTHLSNTETFTIDASKSCLDDVLGQPEVEGSVGMVERGLRGARNWAMGHIEWHAHGLVFRYGKVAIAVPSVDVGAWKNHEGAVKSALRQAISEVNKASRPIPGMPPSHDGALEAGNVRCPYGSKVYMYGESDSDDRSVYREKYCTQDGEQTGKVLYSYIFERTKWNMMNIDGVCSALEEAMTIIKAAVARGSLSGHHSYVPAETLKDVKPLI